MSQNVDSIAGPSPALLNEARVPIWVVWMMCSTKMRVSLCGIADISATEFMTWLDGSWDAIPSPQKLKLLSALGLEFQEPCEHGMNSTPTVCYCTEIKGTPMPALRRKALS